MTFKANVPEQENLRKLLASYRFQSVLHVYTLQQVSLRVLSATLQQEEIEEVETGSATQLARLEPVGNSCKLCAIYSIYHVFCSQRDNSVDSHTPFTYFVQF